MHWRYFFRQKCVKILSSLIEISKNSICHRTKKLVFRAKLTMHTAYERPDNVDPAGVTALAVSKDHKSVYVGDEKGRVFVSYKEKQGALNALETMLITKEYHLQVIIMVEWLRQNVHDGKVLGSIPSKNWTI